MHKYKASHAAPDDDSMPLPCVLIVDDSISVLENLTLLMPDNKYVIDQAQGGLEALDKIYSRDYDLVVLDVIMPVMDGMSLLATLRESYSTTELPVILMTASDSALQVRQGFANGANDYIHKPIDIEVLQARIDSHVFIRRALRREIEHKVALGDHVRSCTQELNRTVEHLKSEVAYRQASEMKLLKFKRVADCSPVGIVITNPDGVIEYSNPVYCGISGRSPGELMGCYDPIFDPDLHSQKHRNIVLKSLQRDGRWQFDTHLESASGENRWENVSVTAIYNALGKLINYLILREDITEPRIAQLKIEYESQHDLITRLPNRVNALKVLEEMCSSQSGGNKLVLYMLDIDHFKDINEAHGYVTADRLLAAVSERLVDSLRHINKNAYFARFGADEFVCVFYVNESEKNAADLLLNSIRQCFENAYQIDEREILISVSIGIVITAKEHTITATELLRQADSALVKSKQIGRGASAYYDQLMSEQVKRTLVIEMELRKALQKGQIEVFYQPIVDARHHDIRCAEALVRWHSESLGWISPAEFIPIAEKSGLIIPLGNFILHAVTEQLAHWRTQGFDLYISINVSAAQLVDQAQFSQQLQSRLMQYNLTSRDIELEVTEHLFLEDNDHNLAMLRLLKQTGCRFAIDDFGTGYSSLCYLTNFDFDKLKIDRHFIKQLLVSEKAQAVTQAIIEIAKSLNMTITAEGVEDMQTLELIQQYGCDLVQGFLFYRPLPSEAFTALLRNQDKTKP